MTVQQLMHRMSKVYEIERIYIYTACLALFSSGFVVYLRLIREYNVEYE